MCAGADVLPFSLLSSLFSLLSLPRSPPRSVSLAGCSATASGRAGGGGELRAGVPPAYRRAHVQSDGDLSPPPPPRARPGPALPHRAQ
eukprot:199021-Rhodomonas_salina.1